MRSGKEADALQGSRRKLLVSFETLEGFRREYRENLSRGGLFIPSLEAVAVREEVEVQLDLSFRSASFRLRAEVVSVVPEELAHVGGTPGVAVQLLNTPEELRCEFEPIVGEVPAPDPARQLGERRSAPRRAARVVGRLCTADASLAVCTRNLSHTGVLVSIEGIPPTPVGETVHLRLVHPVTGQELEVEGVVVRHVESGGGVPALAVAFISREAARPEVQQFVDHLQGAHHARSLAGISGVIEEVGLASLIQSFAAASPQGTLTVSHFAEEGRVAFDGGQLVSARLGSVTGTKALARMLAWQEGEFEFHAHVDEGVRGDSLLSLQAALLDATRQVDEIHRLEPLPIAMADRIEVAAPSLDGEGGQLGKTEAAILDLAAAGFNVRAMLDVVPEEDHAVLRALVGLLDRGLVRKAR
jgi:Tfp pilus assembly protein PilZ